jgi:NitT/TauT family transport system substrate-binding protein
MLRISSYVLVILLLAAPVAARSEPAQIRMAAGGKSQLNFLPLTLAERLGYFKEANLNVEVNDFQSGSKSVEALIGGSVDLVTGAYEHTLLMQSRHVAMETLVLLTKSYGAVIAVTKANAASYKSPADLKGKNIGVSAPGSSMALALQIFLKKNGMTLDDVSVIGIGQSAGAIAAVKYGKVYALSNPDPVISRLQNDNEIVPIVDTRTEAGMKSLYGGYIAASAISTTPDFVAKRPKEAEAFVRAIVRALHWIDTASTEQIMQMVPPDYYGPDKSIYQQALEAYRSNFSKDGRVTPDLAGNTLNMLKSGPLAGVPNLTLDGTYDGSFVEKANATH